MLPCGMKATGPSPETLAIHSTCPPPPAAWPPAVSNLVLLHVTLEEKMTPSPTVPSLSGICVMDGSQVGRTHLEYTGGRR